MSHELVTFCDDRSLFSLTSQLMSCAVSCPQTRQSTASSAWFPIPALGQWRGPWITSRSQVDCTGRVSSNWRVRERTQTLEQLLDNVFDSLCNWKQWYFIFYFAVGMIVYSSLGCLHCHINWVFSFAVSCRISLFVYYICVSIRNNGTLL